MLWDLGLTKKYRSSPFFSHPHFYCHAANLCTHPVNLQIHPANLWSRHLLPPPKKKKNLIVTNGTFHFDTVNLAEIQIFVEDIRLDFLEKENFVFICWKYIV